MAEVIKCRHCLIRDDTQMKFFISSTKSDLASYRNIAIQYINVLNHKIGAMEFFGSDSQAPLEVCLEELKNSDVFIGIIAYRYGTVHPGYGKSFTEAEYDFAISLKKPCLIFLASEEDPSKFIIEPAKFLQEKEYVNQFRDKLKKDHTISFFDSEYDFLNQFRFSLFRQFPDIKPIVNSPDILDPFILQLETHPNCDLAYDISNNLTELRCLSDLGARIDWLENTLTSVAESLEMIPDDLKTVFARLNLDKKLLEQIPSYENPLINRQWELVHIGFPNIVFRLRTLKMLLEYFYFNRQFAVEPSEDNKQQLELVTKELEKQLNGIYLD